MRITSAVIKCIAMFRNRDILYPVPPDSDCELFYSKLPEIDYVEFDKKARDLHKRFHDVDKVFVEDTIETQENCFKARRTPYKNLPDPCYIDSIITHGIINNKEQGKSHLKIFAHAGISPFNENIVPTHPRQVNCYFFSFSFGGGSIYYALLTRDRELVKEIHNKVLEKLKETKSLDATDDWFLNQSEYSTRKSNVYPKRNLILALE